MLRENRLGIFAHRKAFAGKGAFLHAQLRRFRQAQVGGHKVAGTQHHKVARHKLRGGDFLLPPVPHHMGPRAGKAAQRLDRALRAAFLYHADHGVDIYDRKDDNGRKAVGPVAGLRDGKGYARRDQQDDRHEIRKLGKETCQKALFLRLFQFVAAGLAQTPCGLFFGKSGVQAGSQFFSAFFLWETLPFQIYHLQFFGNVYSQLSGFMV